MARRAPRGASSRRRSAPGPQQAHPRHPETSASKVRAPHRHIVFLADTATLPSCASSQTRVTVARAVAHTYVPICARSAVVPTVIRARRSVRRYRAWIGGFRAPSLPLWAANRPSAARVAATSSGLPNGLPPSLLTENPLQRSPHGCPPSTGRTPPREAITHLERQASIAGRASRDGPTKRAQQKRSPEEASSGVSFETAFSHPLGTPQQMYAGPSATVKWSPHAAGTGPQEI